MTFLSLFAGVGGFDLGFELAGWECVGQVEIDEQCREVLTRHWPEVPKYEDVRELDGRDFAGVDAITGGFPCQDLSVAGKRAGLAGERSGLWWEMHRIIGEARPRYVVWENVPGLLSADDGGAMGAVLHSLADIGYFGAWRVLDSQWFGVAQRRRRVFGVFAEGRAGGERAREVLLEPEGSGWTPAPRGGEREGVANTLAAGAQSDRRGYRRSPEDTYVPDVVGQATSCKWAKGSSGSAGDEHHNLVFQQNQRDELRLMGGDGQQAGALAADPGMKQQNFVAGAGVRRLTPTECERLQGFPNGWTDECADTHRYRMMGNAVTVNVIYWLALRLRDA